MPELPEVQTVINKLKEDLIGKAIIDYKINYPKMIENIDEFKLILNKPIINIFRIGKFIIFDFDNLYLVSHLRMEGKYFIKDKIEDINKHEHIIFYFNDFTLRYHDVRKFGIMCIRTSNLYDIPPISNVGLEPFDIKAIDLYNSYNKNRPIKDLLLDQGLMSGLGNIYADEVLYLSRIEPTRLGSTLSIDDINCIINSSIKILNEAILDGGTTIRSYTSSLGVRGHHQDKLLVHTRAVCPKGHEITKIKVKGRTTYYCKECLKDL